MIPAQKVRQVPQAGILLKLEPLTKREQATVLHETKLNKPAFDSAVQNHPSVFSTLRYATLKQLGCRMCFRAVLLILPGSSVYTALRSAPNQGHTHALGLHKVDVGALVYSLAGPGLDQMAEL